jgi:hypothetical protein
VQYSGGIRGRLRTTHIQVFRLEKGRMGNDGHLNDIFERKIERKAGYMETERDSASRSAASDTCRTTVTVTSSAVDGYTLPLETFDDLAHALPRVFRGMFGYPQGEVKSSLKWGSYERE